jgi:tellurite resistance protein
MIMKFFRRAIDWVLGAESAEAAEVRRDASRGFLRAAARAIAMAARSDGETSSEELVAARLAGQKVPVLGALRDSAFDAVLTEAVAKLAAEGEEASLRFIAEAVPEEPGRAQIFSLAAAAVLADRQIQEGEREFLEKLRAALGLAPDEVAATITELAQALQAGNGE